MNTDFHGIVKVVKEGVAVTVQGLTNAVHLNGKHGICKQWDASCCRWQVSFDDGADVKLIRSNNLIVRHGFHGYFEVSSEVMIRGLEIDTWLNGRQGVCKQWSAEANQWQVELSSGELKAFCPEHLVVLGNGLSPSDCQIPWKFQMCQECGVSGLEHGKRLLVCSGCKARHYCTKDCQKLHWDKGHKEECKNLTATLARASSSFGLAGDDVATWVKKNKLLFTGIVAALCAKMPEESISSHVVLLLATYNENERRVVVTSHDILPSEVAEHKWASFLPSGTSLKEIQSKMPAALPRQAAIVTTLVRVSCGSNSMFRIIPIGLTQDGTNALKETASLIDVKSLIDSLNEGSCGHEADRVRAISRSSDFKTNLDRASVTNKQIQSYLQPYVAVLALATLHLGNKQLSCHRTHCLEIILKHSTTGHYLIETCNSIAKADAVAQHPLWRSIRAQHK